MLQLRIDSEILAAAAAMWLRLSGRNEMADNSQTKTRVEQTMKTLRKINISRLDLSTEDADREKPYAEVSFYLNKTHIFEIGRARQKKRTMGDISNTAQRLLQ